MIKHTQIKPPSGWIPLQFREWIEFFDLFIILTARDIKLRYKQTLLGIVWVVLQPFLTCFVFSLVFGRLAKIPTEGIPYIMFVLGGMLPWFAFSQIVLRGSNSILSQSHVISKVYFPRIMLPAASSAAALVDFLINLVTVFLLFPLYGVPYSVNLLFIPILTLILLCFAFGLTLILASLNVFYRDFSHILPFMLQIWMFSSPLVYSAKMIPEKWKFIYSINPIAGLIDGFRWALFDLGPFPWQTLSISLISGLGALVVGLYVFNRIERYFVDVI